MDQVIDKPIRHCVVLGHPAPGSFNHAVAEAYCQTVHKCGQVAELCDLYALGFDPLLKAGERPGSADFAPAADVEQELRLLATSSIVTMIYPIWFGMPPAIIKGYVDRVMGAGFTVNPQRVNPLLRGKRLMLFSSSASTRNWLEEQGQWVALRRAFETYLATIFGMVASEHVHFDAIVEGIEPRLVNEALAVVRAKTRLACAMLLHERHRDHARRLINMAAG